MADQNQLNLVSGIVGIAGVALGAWAATRRERSNQLRDRMLEVADPFVVELRRLSLVAFHESDVSTLQREETDAIAVEQMTARIALLFSPDSNATMHADEALSHVRIALSRKARDLSAHPPKPAAVVEHELDQSLVRVEKELTAFLRAASSIIRAGGRNPLRHRIGRMLQSLRHWVQHPTLIAELKRAGRAHTEAAEALSQAHAAYAALLSKFGLSDEEARRLIAEADTDDGEPGRTTVDASGQA